MNYLMWLLKAAIFFTLFAFALNNQQAVAVNFFFGTFWKAPLILVVLATFGIGLALGVLLMMPRWWKKRKTNQLSAYESTAQLTVHGGTKQSHTAPDNSDIPRHGL